MTAARKHAGLNGTLFVSIDPDSYHRDPCIEPSLSSSCAWTLVNQSPLAAFAQHPRHGGTYTPPTQATDRGDLFHALLLHAGKTLHVIKADSYRSQAAKDERDRARVLGMIPVLEDAYADAQSACRIISNRLDELGVKLNRKKSELGMLWVDRASDGTPVQCRALVDNWTRPVEYDVKTIGRATRDSIAWAVTDYGAHVQRAAYRRGLEANEPKLRGRIQQRLLFVETNPPYDVVPVRLSAMFVELGETLWQRALDTWAECTRTGFWPGVLGEDDVMIIDPPLGYLKRFED